jgi:hypothetical protein
MERPVLQLRLGIVKNVVSTANYEVGQAINAISMPRFSLGKTKVLDPSVEIQTYPNGERSIHNYLSM